MKNHITDPLSIFNQLYKEVDEIYHIYAKRHGISDTALWLLYSLSENNAAYTQRELCDEWHCPPQTINSALKNLERKGYIELKSIAENHKNKLIVLTKEGLKLTQNIISPLINAERSAFQSLSEDEREALLSLTKKYVDFLKTKVN